MEDWSGASRTSRTLLGLGFLMDHKGGFWTHKLLQNWPNIAEFNAKNATPIAASHSPPTDSGENKTSEGKKAENLRKDKVPWSKIVSATVSVKKQGIEMAFIPLTQIQAAAEVALKLHFEIDCRSSKALCEVPAAIPDGCAVLFETWKIQVFKDEKKKKSLLTNWR
ncbi:hypothetical protein DVH24_001312 [Malus domestica]|uniref:Uncharacterized protein n=1 Tax=Malus domestica TaxID=3750 RepID=A0A498K195_MALDO|nr:hypothetical protein DVH24_001312 [Malus domestica]